MKVKFSFTNEIRTPQRIQRESGEDEKGNEMRREQHPFILVYENRLNKVLNKVLRSSPLEGLIEWISFNKVLRSSPLEGLIEWIFS